MGKESGCWCGVHLDAAIYALRESKLMRVHVRLKGAISQASEKSSSRKHGNTLTKEFRKYSHLHPYRGFVGPHWAQLDQCIAAQTVRASQICQISSQSVKVGLPGRSRRRSESS
jgi:hypothetical protein